MEQCPLLVQCLPSVREVEQTLNRHWVLQSTEGVVKNTTKSGEQEALKSNQWLQAGEYQQGIATQCWATAKYAGLIPSRNKTLNQCWFTVGPPSTTLDQR